MADEVDFANAAMERSIANAVNELRQNTPKDTKGSPFCVECGEAVPDGRQKLGFKLCVPCAEESERRRSLYAD
jgi:RNA polymerase-binding transcription factor DksA